MAPTSRNDEKTPKAPGNQKPAPAPEGPEEVAPCNHQLLESSSHPNMHKSIWGLPPSTGCRINLANLLPAEPFLQLLVLLFLLLCQTGNRPQPIHLTKKQEDEKTVVGKRKKTKQPPNNNNNKKVNGKLSNFVIFRNCLGFDVVSCHANWTANAITWANGEQENHLKLLPFFAYLLLLLEYL